MARRRPPASVVVLWSDPVGTRLAGRSAGPGQAAPLDRHADRCRGRGSAGSRREGPRRPDGGRRRVRSWLFVRLVNPDLALRPSRERSPSSAEASTMMPAPLFGSSTRWSHERFSAFVRRPSGRRASHSAHEFVVVRSGVGISHLWNGLRRLAAAQARGRAVAVPRPALRAAALAAAAVPSRSAVRRRVQHLDRRRHAAAGPELDRDDGLHAVLQRRRCWCPSW